MTEGDDIMAAINHKITPHLWYDKEAKEATELYTSVFPQSRITHITTIRDTLSGDCDVVSFGLAGQPFMAISAGPLFKFNPSISFVVNFDSLREGMHARVLTQCGAGCLPEGVRGEEEGISVWSCLQLICHFRLFCYL